MPDLPVRERIAEAHRRASEAHQWRGTRVNPYTEVTCWCWAKFDTRAEWLEHQQLIAADAVLTALADLPDTAVEPDDLPRLTQGTVLRLHGGQLAEVERLQGQDSLVLWVDGWTQFADAPARWFPATVLHIPAAFKEGKA